MFNLGHGAHLFVFHFKQSQVPLIDDLLVLNLHKLGNLAVGFVVFVLADVQCVEGSLQVHRVLLILNFLLNPLQFFLDVSLGVYPDLDLPHALFLFFIQCSLRRLDISKVSLKGIRKVEFR